MKVGVLVSGSGTNLQALLDAEARGELAPGEIAVVVSNVPARRRSRARAAAGKPAESSSITAASPIARAFEDRAARRARRARRRGGRARRLHARADRALLDALPAAHRQHPPVAAAGVPRRRRAPRRRSRTASSCRGVTVHFVDAGLDAGPIIAQAAVPVLRRRRRRGAARADPARGASAAAGGRAALGGGPASRAKVASWWSVPSNSYDLVVLGDDLAALVCATLCARRGMRTLVLGDDRPARYTLGPHKLPVEPALWPVGRGLAGRARAQGAPRRARAAPQAARAEDRRAAGRARTCASTSAPIGSPASSRASSATPPTVGSIAGHKAGDVARLLDPLARERARVPRRRVLRAARGRRELAELAGDSRRRVVARRRDRPARRAVAPPRRDRAAPPRPRRPPRSRARSTRGAPARLPCAATARRSASCSSRS